MFESFGRGFRMILASFKMGWQDRRLFYPSILTIFTNYFFAIVILLQAKQGFSGGAQNVAGKVMSMGSVNGPMDQSGFSAMSGATGSDAVLWVTCIVCVWWLTNRFLEGVTTALVYSHLTEGAGSGKFSVACQAVFTSLPAIVMLGIVTFIAKKLAGWMRTNRGSGVMGFGVDFLGSIIEVFWTLAGHLILPSIVIEGSSFWGALKRADKIAQSNLLTIGVGEVGVDLICRVLNGLVYIPALVSFAGVWYAQAQAHISVNAFVIGLGILAWAGLVVFVNALSLYIRSAFYACLYVWAIEAEAVEETERAAVSAPGPLAAALA